MKDICGLVASELSEIIELLNIGFNELNSIQKDINDFLQLPSKRIRSLVTLLFLKSHGEKINKQVLHLLSAVELLHNASLLHDDVIDGSNERRSHTTINKKYSSKISVLAGNVVLARALEELINIPNYKILIEDFLMCTNKMCEAEFKQFFLRGNIPTLEEYIDICRGKTAILFVISLKLSAKLMGLNELVAEELGDSFGILFQINNDLEEKSVQEDENNGIYTALKILGVEKTNILIDNYKEKLERVIKELPKNKYSEALEVLIKQYGK